MGGLPTAFCPRVSVLSRACCIGHVPNVMGPLGNAMLCVCVLVPDNTDKHWAGPHAVPAQRLQAASTRRRQPPLCAALCLPQYCAGLCCNVVLWTLQADCQPFICAGCTGKCSATSLSFKHLTVH